VSLTIKGGAKLCQLDRKNILMSFVIVNSISIIIIIFKRARESYLSDLAAFQIGSKG